MYPVNLGPEYPFRMRSSAQGSVSFPWLGATLLLLTLGAVLATPAQAGCSSHYTTSELNRQSHENPSGFELLSRAGAIPSPENEPVPNRPKPCTGALCSGAPALPTSALPALSPFGVEHWAALPLVVSPSHFGTHAYPPFDEGLNPVEFCATVFHPPRPPFSAPLSRLSGR